MFCLVDTKEDRMIRGEKDYRWQRGSREVDDVDLIGHCKQWSFYSEGKEGHGKVLSSCIILLGPDTFTSWQIEGAKVEEVTLFIFLVSIITEDSDCSCEVKDSCSLEGKLWKPRQHIKNWRHHFADEGWLLGFLSEELEGWKVLFTEMQQSVGGAG